MDGADSQSIERHDRRAHRCASSPRARSRGADSSPASAECRLIDAFLRQLKQASISTVFGVPGGLLHPFFEAVERDDEMRLVVTKHEEGAAFMADGFARASNALAVCAGTSGPGSTNLMTGVGVAFSDAIPMLVITGQAASASLGKGAVQETGPNGIDIVGMFAPITKYSAMVERPDRLAHHLRLALRLALCGRPGPVHLNVPVDFWQQSVTFEGLDSKRYSPPETGFNPRAVDRACAALCEARRPLILAGGGARAPGIQSHLVDLVERLGARLVTTPRGKGAFPEDHPQWLGICGYAGHEVVTDTILGDEVDVLMVVGASLNETTTFGWSEALQPSRALIQLDIDSTVIGRNYPVDIPLLGEAAIVLDEMNRRLESTLADQPAHSTWDGTDIAAPAPSRQPAPAGGEAAAGALLCPKQWRADLSQALPSDVMLFSDVGGHMLFNLHELRVSQGQDFVLNLGFGSMGHGTVAPMGAALADPQRPIVAIVGDGCFAMNGMELLAAVEYQIPVVWVVENNQMHGISWHISKALSGQPLASIRNEHPVDIAAIATAMGLRTHVVDRPGQIQEVLADVLEHRQGPTLIEVRVDPEVSPPIKDRTRSIGGFR